MHSTYLECWEWEKPNIRHWLSMQEKTPAKIDQLSHLQAQTVREQIIWVQIHRLWCMPKQATCKTRQSKLEHCIFPTAWCLQFHSIWSLPAYSAMWTLQTHGQFQNQCKSYTNNQREAKPMPKQTGSRHCSSRRFEALTNSQNEMHI